MGLAIIWLSFCFIIASVGKKREIGGTGAFFISLLLSPLVGGLVVALSKPLAVETPAHASDSVADELQKLVSLRDAGALSQAEFEQQKARLLGNNH